MANSFTVERSSQGGISVLGLQGFLDAHTAPDFEKVVQEDFDAGRVQIIVNCQKLTYISSAGLGVFMSYIEELRAAGGDIKICGMTPKVYQVFEILGFPAIFDIVDDVPAAIQRFADVPVKEA